MEKIIPMLFLGFMFSLRLNAAETAIEQYDGLLASNSVQAPPGKFLLLRKKSQICAIKFIGAWRGNDKTKGTLFRSGDESFRARYAWSLGKKIKDSWELHPPTSFGESQVEQKKLVGIGRFALGGGDFRLRCGSIVVNWSAPAHVYFYSNHARDEGNEIAITPWSEFEEIKPNDESLLWLRFDKHRPVTVIKTKQ